MNKIENLFVFIYRRRPTIPDRHKPCVNELWCVLTEGNDSALIPPSSFFAKSQKRLPRKNSTGPDYPWQKKERKLIRNEKFDYLRCVFLAQPKYFSADSERRWFKYVGVSKCFIGYWLFNEGFESIIEGSTIISLMLSNSSFSYE